MKSLLSTFFLLLSLQVVSQIRYEPGYIIDNNGQRTEVLVLNKDWRSNPSRISYRLSEDGNSQTADIEEIIEFGIGDNVKYERFTVPIDRSGKQVRNLTGRAEPIFTTQTVFLRQLLAGEAKFYVYKEGSLERYYLSTPDAEITPLIHKEYLKENRIAANNEFREQLYNLVSCGGKTPGDLQKLAYKEKDLIAYLESYHKCRESEYDILKEEDEKMKFHFVLKAGVDFATLKVEEGLYVKGTETELDPSLRVGAEIEAVMPFNRNKWALFVEPAYNSQNIEKRRFVSNIPYNRHEVDLSVDYKFISIATGARHYMFLSNSSKLFLAAGLSFDVPIKTSVYIDRDNRYELDPQLEETKSEAYLNLGLGYNYRGWSAEIRYNGGRKVLGSNIEDTHYVLDWETKVSSFSVLLGYQLF